ncbi:hypothetical protein ID866_9741 [Astraeus odoratus]|nr:hypothetical protein ID866_9741 [Astraeus odoratus]
MDALEELSERASRFSINLNAVVDRDATIPPLRGGNANVYAGTLQSTGMRVAVKTVRSAPLSDINTLKNIFREVHLWSKLRHKNVVSLLGIATKFEQTNHAIDPRPLLVDIASGLHYLHTHEEGPIFHGDLKGLNVLISDDGRALLTDFGFSYLVTSSFSMTVDAPLGGTLRWMAPEILDNHEISAEGDVWAFGMTTLELFTRKPPFHDLPTPGSVMARILRGPPDRPSDASTCFRMTDYWWDICTLCWTRDPLSRPTMTEIVAIVQEYMVRVDSLCTTGFFCKASSIECLGTSISRNVTGPSSAPGCRRFCQFFSHYRAWGTSEGPK